MPSNRENDGGDAGGPETNQSNDSTANQPFAFSLRTLLIAVTFMCVLLGAVAVIVRLQNMARRAASSSAAQGPLNQVVLALHNYHEYYGSLPPAYVADANGRPMHSWRVLILPFVESSDLYDQYDFSQAWNSPANASLMDKMPRVFASNTEDDSKRFTNIMVVTGEKTAFPYAKPTRFEDFTDGQENVLLVTETANSRVPWTKPQDIEFDGLLTGPAPVVSAVSWRAPFITFADGIKAYDVMSSAAQRDLQDLATIAGQEKTTRASMLEEGKLEK